MANYDLRKSACSVIRYLIVVFTILGILLGFFSAKQCGLSVWYKGLTYFTTQSNIWLGVIYTIIIAHSFLKQKNNYTLATLHNCKYYFTVSIAMTGFVFCFFLAPFADSSYAPWSPYSIIVHVITPLLAITEFYLDEYNYKFSFKGALTSITPALIYYSITIFLCCMLFDFGRGDPFPYFFLDVYSSASLLGFSSSSLQKIGTIWWLLLFSYLMFGIACLLLKTKSLFGNKKAP
jgi:hypothetical protein